MVALAKICPSQHSYSGNDLEPPRQAWHQDLVVAFSRDLRERVTKMLKKEREVSRATGLEKWGPTRSSRR